MPDGTVTPLRPRAAAAYTDTAALNDIHALLTATEPGQAALKDIALILARTGRPMTEGPRHRGLDHRDRDGLARRLGRRR